jgi:integrase
VRQNHTKEGNMGLTKRKEGYYVEFPIIDDGKTLMLARGVPGAKLKRWKVGSMNKTAAKQQEALIKTDLMKGIIKSEKVRALTHREWATSYLNLEEVKRLRSYKDRKDIVENQLIPFFGDMLLADIRPEHVEVYRGQRKKRDGSTPCLQTINNDHIVLKHSLNVAIRRGFLTTNPASKVPIPDPHNERDRVLSEEEWNKLYQAAKPHLKPVLLVAYHLGQRLGEIISLTWDRVDIQRGFITLRSIDTKTKKPRQVPLTPAVRSELVGLSKVRSLTTNRVFLYKGVPIQRIHRTFKTAQKDAGVQDFRFHDLRHCAATNLRRAGVDTATAMRIVGHKSEKMWKRYNAIEERDLLNAASKLNSYHESNTVITPAGCAAPSASVSA